MREYGQLQCSFWQSADIRELSDAAKLLAVYLITGPHSNGIGCYWLPDGYVMADFGWPAETVSKAFEELSRKGFANRFENVVFIPNFLRWNAISNPNVASARQREFEALPKGEAKKLVAQALLAYGKHLSEEFRTVLETVSKGFPKGLPKQNPTLPYPTQKGPRPERGAASRARRRCPPDFVVTDDMRAWAAEKAPGVDIDTETEVFREFEFARAYTDWPATWRRWMRRAAERAPPKPNGAGKHEPERPLTRYERIAEIQQRAIEDADE